MKTEPRESALQDWMLDLPFTQQALLMLATRGPDGMNKDNSSKPIIHFVRGLVIKAAYPNYNPQDEYNPDWFMCGNYNLFHGYAEKFFSDTDAYPMHFLMHLFHAAEVIGYNYPDEEIRVHWQHFYQYACKSFHMKPESKDELNNRLKF